MTNTKVTQNNAVVVVATNTGPQGPAGTPLRYIVMDGASTEFDLNDGKNLLTLERIVRRSSALDFTTDADGKITVLKSGLYNITYNINGYQDATTVDHQLEYEVERNGTTPLSGSQSFSYITEPALSFSGTNSLLVQLNANDTLQMVVRLSNPTGDPGDIKILEQSSHLSVQSVSMSGPPGPAGPVDFLTRTVGTDGDDLEGDDNGKLIITEGQFEIIQNTFITGNVVRVYNNTAEGITLKRGAAVTLRKAGGVGNGQSDLTLAGRGYCTIVCVASEEFVVEGTAVT